MSVDLHFDNGTQVIAARLALDPRQCIADWGALRSRMIRERDPAFTRDEWAYLLQFLAPERLELPWRDSFGTPLSTPATPGRIAAPRACVALWLPNNVSLLGCLSLVLISTTSAQVRVKSGSRSNDLCAAFVAYARTRLPEGALRRWLTGHVEVRAFGRDHPDNLAMAQWADVRIFFGGDRAAQEVQALPHKPGSLFVEFGDKVSEAWFSPSQARDAEAVRALASVFAIFGQAGCTSPKRLLIVDGREEDARAFSECFASAWQALAPDPVAQAQASEVVLGEQHARASGLQALRLRGNAALLVLSRAAPPRTYCHLGLQLQWGSLDEIAATAAPNLQTVGHAGSVPPPAWIETVSRTAANRMVPLARMHDFGHVWDGFAWWHNLFRWVEL
jgi:hypothetical protein